MELKSIYEYLDYRVYLADWFAAKKRQNPRYSHRMVVRQMGQKSPSFLTDVIKGRRNLTMDTSAAFCRLMKLSRSHRRYFLLLVDFHQADSDEERQTAWSEICIARRHNGAQRLEGEAFEILSNWENSAIHQLARRSDFRLDPGWIAKTVCPPISAKVARQAVERLFGAGLLVRGEKGRVEAVDADLVTPPCVLGLAVRNYHRSMINLALDSVERFPANRRSLLGVTVAVPTSVFAEIRNRLDEVALEMHALCEAANAESDEVIQINLQAFPLAKSRKP